MTSTQRSESANHMLKNYIPPGCSMSLFVKQYDKLLFDRLNEEGFQDKRTKLGGAVLKANLPLEKHASKIYTRKMFEIFGDLLYGSGQYDVQEIIPMTSYIAKHINADKREKWCKVKFSVLISKNGAEYNLDCGLFKHMGMLCSHVLKVMIILGVRSIPTEHIVKRWTVHAKDNLSLHLRYYENENLASVSSSRRHHLLYIAALDVVQMGDSNKEAYDEAMRSIVELKTRLVDLARIKDGKGLMARRDATDLAHSVMAGSTVQSEAVSIGVSCEYGDTEVESARRYGHMGAPPRRKLSGRPTTSTDKPPYEERVKRLRNCNICQLPGHTRTTCPQREENMNPTRKPPTCTNCGIPGHGRNKCTNPLLSVVLEESEQM